MSIRTSCKKIEKNCWFLQSLLDLEGKKFGMLLNFSAELSKMLSKFLYIYSEKNCFLWEKFVFVNFFGYWAKKLAFNRKVFGRVVKTCILGVHRIILKKFFSSTFFSFSFLYQKFMLFCLKSSARLTTLLSTGPEGFLEGKIFCQRKIFFLNTFWQNLKNFGFMAKTLGNVVKTALSVPLGSFSGEISILELFFFFFRSRTLSEESWVFCPKFRQVCQNCVFACPKGSFEENVFCHRKIVFLNTYYHRTKVSAWLPKSFWQCCQICILTVPRINFRKKICCSFFSLFWTLSGRNSTFHPKHLRQCSQNFRSRFS